MQTLLKILLILMITMTSWAQQGTVISPGSGGIGAKITAGSGGRGVVITPGQGVVAATTPRNGFLVQGNNAFIAQGNNGFIAQ